MTAIEHTAQLSLDGYRPPRFCGWSYVAALDESRLNTALKRVLHRLLDGEAHRLSELRTIGGSAADSRIRDLRRAEHGGFTIHSTRDEDHPDSGDWIYRLATDGITQAQCDTVFLRETRRQAA